MMFKHPEAFQHIPQQNLRENDRTTAEWVQLAEKLAKKNGGKLPPKACLREKGFAGLVQKLFWCPELFSHIEQQSLIHSNESAVALAESLAKKNGGNIPTPVWLRKNNYGWLASRIRTNPDLFKHLTQVKLVRSEEECVATAEKLAKKNGGKIPPMSWLTSNGYNWLHSRIKNHPSLFKHLSQVKLLKTDAQCVATAEKLAKKNGGKIPNSKWLTSNGYNWLHHRITHRPDLFKHLTQVKLVRSEEECVATAEKLAKKNGGKIPPMSWLIRNQYEWLYSRVKNHPHLFSHLDMERLTQTDTEAVATAETLTKKNGGVVPTSTWLTEHGYGALYARMRTKPELFSHLKRVNPYKTLDDYIQAAKNLAKEHGGVIPSSRWLQDNGFHGLDSRIRQNRRDFQGITQVRLRKTPEQNLAVAEQLAEKNGGTIPSLKWLQENDHGYLRNFIVKHPKLFSHLQRDVLDRQGNLICSKTGPKRKSKKPVAKR
jgi:hypothetical protein